MYFDEVSKFTISDRIYEKYGPVDPFHIGVIKSVLGIKLILTDSLRTKWHDLYYEEK